MSPTQQSPALLALLRQQLEAAKAQDNAVHNHNSQGELIQIPNTGKIISGAYEQLRNAAEYTEEHLLLQRAIRRFYNRYFSFFAKRTIGNVGEELIVELSLAGYLHNGEFSTGTATQIKQLAEQYLHTYHELRNHHVSREEASDWVLAILSVETEAILNPHNQLSALAYTMYQHFMQLFPRDIFAHNQSESEQYEISLYIAIHQALLKSDLSVVRHDLMRMYRQSPQNLEAFIQFNRSVSELYMSKFTHRLKRAVSKYGAPWRILKSLVDDRSDLNELLMDRERFLDAFSRQVNKEYSLINRRLNKGIIKSIIFIFITKVIIGLSIEVPYDLIMVGRISYLPLTINLLFPPLYMASLKLGLKVPSQANAHALRTYIDKALFSNEPATTVSFRDSLQAASTLTKWLYSILFFIPFGITVYILNLLHFNIIQGVIFFAFLSTASFFGFRLSSMIRELEIVTPQGNFLATIRDFFYLPFILVGQWLSSKYAKINAVAYFLDIAIELPLKTVLRLVRQWTRFLNEKHDEIY